VTVPDRHRWGAPIDLLIEERAVRVSNPDKVLWPATGATKQFLVDYYLAVAPVLIPHLADRPLTLARYPDGVEGKGWFQTTCPHPPEWMPTVSARGRVGRGREYCVVNEAAGLVWTANLGAIELHPLLSRRQDLHSPTALAFDLDPGPDATLVDCCRLALWLREFLEQLGLRSWAKISGWAGVHVYVPLNTPHTYDQTKAFARCVAHSLAMRHPHRVTDRLPKAERRGRVFIDWSQNDASKSLAAPYSLRARPWPSVSTPITWREVEEALVEGSAARLWFDGHAVLGRIGECGDLFRPVLEVRQHLP
jgi:bifunctional non-homologous end joining protein LigD